MAANLASCPPHRPGWRVAWPAWLVGLALAGGSASAQAYPPPDHDSFGIGGGITLTTPIGPGGLSFRQTTIEFDVGATAPVYASDGNYSGGADLHARLSSSVWLLPLVTGDIREAFKPLTLHVGFNADLRYAPTGDTSDPGFGLDNRAELVLPLDGSTGGFELQSTLSVDPGDLGSAWLHFRFPLLEFSYNSASGTTHRLLGVVLELGSVGGVPCSLGQACEFDHGQWGFTVQTVPEPAPAALGLAGGLFLWALGRRPIRRAQAGSLPDPRVGP